MISHIEIIPTGTHAIMAVDPGGTTGVAAGYIDLRRTLKATLLEGLTRRASIEVKGEWRDQARQLADLMWQFKYKANAENGLSLDRIHYVFEDFVLRMPARTTNLTSIWVAAAATFAGAHGGEVTWQQAGAAKALASDDRLRLWGLWERGSAHKRDAWRHFALYAGKLLG